MKTTKKLLLALVALLIVSSISMAVVFANELPVGDISQAGALMGKIDSATTVAEKIAAIEAFDAYMAEHTFPDDPIVQLNYAIIVENVNAAKLQLTEEHIAMLKENAGYRAVCDFSNANAAVAHLAQVDAFFASLYFDKNSEAYKTFAKEYEDATASARAEYNKRIEESYTAPYGEYDYPLVKIYDFEPNEKGQYDKISQKNTVKKGEFKNDGLGSLGSSGYYFEEMDPRSADDPFAAMLGLTAGSYSGFVFEFDYYHLPDATLQLSRGTCPINGVNSGTTEWGTFTTGSFSPGHSEAVSKSNRPKKIEQPILVENAWNRIAYAFVKETGTFKVYVNYEYLTSFKWTNPGAPVDFVPDSMRFKYTGRGMRLDNLTFYYGTAPRILDRFEHMSEEERFILCSEVVVDEEATFEDREGTYQWMQNVMDNYFYAGEYVAGISEEAKAAVDVFFNINFARVKIFDHLPTIKNSTNYELRLSRYDDLASYLDNQNYIITQVVDGNVVKTPNEEAIGAENTDIIEAVREFIAIRRTDIETVWFTENLDGLKVIYEQLLEIDTKTLGTLADRQKKLAEIDKYIKGVGEQYILPGLEYQTIMNYIQESNDKVAFDEAVKALIAALTSFEKAPSYDAKIKWSKKIEGYVVLEDGTSIFTDMTRLVELSDLKARYESMDEELQITIRDKNAEKVVLAVDFYKRYVINKLNEKLAAETPEGESYEAWTMDTITAQAVLAFVEADYAAFLAGEITEAASWTYVRKYSVIAARAIKEGHSELCKGKDAPCCDIHTALVERLAFHETVYGYYYELIQNEYLEELAAMFLKYEDANTYIDKRGICTYIENYIEKNGVNMEREEAAEYATKLAAIREELSDKGDEPSESEKDYLEQLKVNTGLFIEAVEGMVLAQDQGYHALYDAWQNALKYYYCMEITSDEVKQAIEQYAIFEKQLIDWQTNSDLFIETVNALNTESANTRAGIYEILAKACALKPFTNDTYEGMTQALARYNEEYNKYTQFATAINEEVKQTVTLVMAEREIFTALGAIAKYFAKLFG